MVRSFFRGVATLVTGVAILIIIGGRTGFMFGTFLTWAESIFAAVAWWCGTMVFLTGGIALHNLLTRSSRTVAGTLGKTALLLLLSGFVETVVLVGLPLVIIPRHGTTISDFITVTLAIIIGVIVDVMAPEEELHVTLRRLWNKEFWTQE